MNQHYLGVHEEFSDETAAHLSELLNDLAFAFDGELRHPTSAAIATNVSVPVFSSSSSVSPGGSHD